MLYSWLLLVYPLHCVQVGFIQNDFENFIIKTDFENLYWWAVLCNGRNALVPGKPENEGLYTVSILSFHPNSESEPGCLHFAASVHLWLLPVSSLGEISSSLLVLLLPLKQVCLQLTRNFLFTANVTAATKTKVFWEIFTVRNFITFPWIWTTSNFWCYLSWEMFWPQRITWTCNMLFIHLAQTPPRTALNHMNLCWVSELLNSHLIIIKRSDFVSWPWLQYLRHWRWLLAYDRKLNTCR